MAAVLFQSVHGRERLLSQIDELRDSEKAELAGCLARDNLFFSSRGGALSHAFTSVASPQRIRIGAAMKIAFPCGCARYTTIATPADTNGARARYRSAGDRLEPSSA